MSEDRASILDRLRAERVLSVKFREGKIRFREECDAYFTEYLTPDEVRQLSAELLTLADEFEAIKPPGTAQSAG